MGFANLTLACLALSIPGRPKLYIEDARLVLFPDDASKCPGYNLEKNIRFGLYTVHNPLVAQPLKIGDDALLSRSFVDFSRPTVIYFHAFLEDFDADSGNLIREAYTVRGEHNIIMVSAARYLAGPWYPTAVKNTRVIGLYAAQFIDYLYDRGLKPIMLSLVGHSLGAQTAGVAGGAARQRPARITGLDAALPLFPGLPLSLRLDKNDADFVDMIHTDAGGFGISAAMGHVDFYVNGGRSPQPGCELETVIPMQQILLKFFCSHWKSYQLYAESILNPRSYPSVHCKNASSCIKGRLSPSRGELVYMGYGLNPRVRGTFYTKTTAVSPYTYYKN